MEARCLSDIVFEGSVVSCGRGDIVTLHKLTFILHPINYIYTQTIFIHPNPIIDIYKSYQNFYQSKSYIP